MAKSYRQVTKEKIKDGRKVFVLEGKIVFSAVDLDDAFVELAKHFRGLSEEQEGIECLPDTDVTLQVKK